MTTLQARIIGFIIGFIRAGTLTALIISATHYGFEIFILILIAGVGGFRTAKSLEEKI